MCISTDTPGRPPSLVIKAAVVTESTRWAEKPPCIVPPLKNNTVFICPTSIEHFKDFQRLVWGLSTVMLKTHVPGLPLTTLHAPRAASRVPLEAPVFRNCWSRLTTPFGPAMSAGSQNIKVSSYAFCIQRFWHVIDDHWSGHCLRQDR